MARCRVPDRVDLPGDRRLRFQVKLVDVERVPDLSGERHSVIHHRARQQAAKPALRLVFPVLGQFSFDVHRIFTIAGKAAGERRVIQTR